MDSDAKEYHSYLLRLWQVQTETGFGWRASLENVQTGELLGFEDLEALQQYLEELGFAHQVEKTTLEL